MQRFWFIVLIGGILAAVLAGCSDGGGGTAITNTLPTVALSASPSSIVAGQATTLSWSSTNATTVQTSNFGATQVQSTMLVSPSTTTTYTITVSGVGGQATATTTVTVHAATADTAISSFSTTTFQPGDGLTVTLIVTPPTTTSSYAVEDIPPTGWTVSNISNAGSWDAVNAEVKWGPFFDNTARTLSYTVTPPATASGSYIFSGIASFDGVSVPVTGNQTISNMNSH
jgi:cytoskeletal protein RodZ